MNSLIQSILNETKTFYAGILKEYVDEMHYDGKVCSNTEHLTDFLEGIAVNIDIPPCDRDELLRWVRGCVNGSGGGYALHDLIAYNNSRMKNSQIDEDGLVDRFIKEYIDGGMLSFNDDGHIYCERAVTVPEDDSNSGYYDVLAAKYNSAGECWSWNPGNSSAYCSDGGLTIYLSGFVHPKYVNWAETIYRSYYFMRNETELRMNNSESYITLTSVDTDTDQDIMGGPIVVPCHAMKYNNSMDDRQMAFMKDSVRKSISIILRQGAHTPLSDGRVISSHREFPDYIVTSFPSGRTAAIARSDDGKRKIYDANGSEKAEAYILGMYRDIGGGRFAARASKERHSGFGWLDEEGRWIAPGPVFDFAEDFAGGVAKVVYKGQPMLLTADGRIEGRGE